MPTVTTRPPIKRMLLVAFVVLVASALWAYSTRASIYALQPTAGHRLICYVESSSSCFLLLALWDERPMDALAAEADLHGPVTPVYRFVFFGHDDGTRLRPFQVFTSIQSPSSAFGFTLPYWLFIIMAAAYGGFTLRQWRRRLAHVSQIEYDGARPPKQATPPWFK